MKAGHVETMACTEIGHGALAVFIGTIGIVLFTYGNRGSDSIYNFNLAGFGNDHFFSQVLGGLIKHKNNRRPVLFSEIKRFNRNFKYILEVGSCHGNNAMVAMGAPSGLHRVTLGYMGGVTCGWPTPLDICDDTGGFGHTGVSDTFLLQGKTRAGGCGHDLFSGKGCADDTGHGGDFVFHLDEFATSFG